MSQPSPFRPVAWLAYSAGLALAFLAGCGPSGGNGPNASGQPEGGGAAGMKRIIFVTNGDDPFWDALLQGLKEGEQQFNLKAAGLTVQRDVNDGTAKGQIEKLRQYATQEDIAAVAVSVIQADNSAIIEEMKALQAKGVKVITVDGDVNRELYRDARPYYIGTDNITGGRVLGVAAKALLDAKMPEHKGYVQFAGFTDNDNARNRMNGVKEKLEGYTEKDRMPDEMDLRRARDNVRNAMSNHPDLAALIGIWAYNAPAIVDVVVETKSRDKFVVGTFDAQALAIQHMEQGNIDVMVVQNPFDMGVQTVRLCKAMIEGDEKTIAEMFPRLGQPDGDIYTTGLRVVVPKADTPVTKELFETFGPGVVEYMLLPEFQAWLKKYNLQSS